MFDEVEEQLRQILADGMGIDKNRVQQGSTLQDWGGDPLLFLETVVVIEQRYGVSLSDRQEQIADFDALVRIVRARSGVAGAAPA